MFTISISTAAERALAGVANGAQRVNRLLGGSAGSRCGRRQMQAEAECWEPRGKHWLRRVWGPSRCCHETDEP